MIYIRKRRERIGLTQVQLADKLNISKNLLCMYEAGKATPRAEKLPDIAAALGCTIDDLYREEGA